MRKTLKKLFALLVCLSLCAGTVLPVAATNESNDRGYVFSATASEATIDATEDTTVTVTISANKPITANSYQFFFIDLPEGFEIDSVTDLAGFTTDIDIDAQKTFVTWTGNDKITDETAVGNDIVAITYNIAAGTAPGQYTLGVQEMFLDDFNMSKYETSAIASTTVTIAEKHVCTPDEAVKENVVEATCTEDGSYDLVVNCCDCGEEMSRETIVEKATGEHNWDTNALACTNCKAPLAHLTAIELACEADIRMRLKFFLPESILSDPDAYGVMILNGVEERIEIEDIIASKDSSNRYWLTLGISSPFLTNDITAKIYDGEGNVVNIYDYTYGTVEESVTRKAVDWIDSALEKGNDNQKKLARGIAVYGGYAQIFFDYKGVDNTNSDTPAYNILKKYSIDIPTLEDITADSISAEHEYVYSDNDIGIEGATQESFLEAALYHRIYLNLTGNYGIESFKFTMVDPYTKETVELEAFYNSTRKQYYVDIPDIPALLWDYRYTVSVTNTETDEVYTMTTSIMSWIKRMLNGSKVESQKNLGKAIYYYNQIANEYFASVDR